MIPDNGKPCAVLLAEDNMVNKRLITLILKQLGIVPTVVSDGLEAVDKALNQEFNLILMDMHMPRMDGLEATNKIKAMLGEGAPPIIAITADTIHASMEEAKRAGVDAYLTKPISREKLEAVVEQFYRSECR